MVSQKQLPKNWYPSSRSLVGVCLHFNCMRCIWRIFALFGTKVNPPFLCCCKINPAEKCLWLHWCCGPKFKAASKVDWESAKLTELPFTLDWTTCYQKEIPHYPCQTQCSGKGHHLSLRLMLLWLDKKLGKVSSQNDEWDYWK